MIDDIVKKWATHSVFILFWALFYIILGFEPTVVALLLFILAKMRN